MKFLCALMVLCALSAQFIEATYYQTFQSPAYRVRRQGVKGTRQQRVQYVQQEEGYDSSAQLSGSRSVRPLPSRPRGPARQQYQEEQSSYNQVGGGQADAEPAGSIGGVQGVAGKDYPAYSQIPQTQFSCSGVPYEPGMYADEETQCQAYHVCFQGRKESFLCGVGTVFNQAILTCDYWHAVECGRSKEFYYVNEELGKAGAEPGPGGAQPQPQSQPQWRPQQQPRPQPQPQPARQIQSQGQYQSTGQYQQTQSQYAQSQSRSQYAQQPQAQVQYASQQQQYRKSPRPQPQANYAKANVQVDTRVESVSQGSQVEYAQEDQAAVHARQQLVAPGPRPQYGQPQGQPRLPQRAQPGKSKYREGGDNQLSPSVRSKALAQVQQPQYPAEAEQPYQPPARPYKPQPPPRQVDNSFRDTQQTLTY